jgi:hypothetical protein
MRGMKLQVVLSNLMGGTREMIQKFSIYELKNYESLPNEYNRM